jgi:hypothetical protein
MLQQAILFLNFINLVPHRAWDLGSGYGPGGKQPEVDYLRMMVRVCNLGVHDGVLV